MHEPATTNILVVDDTTANVDLMVSLLSDTYDVSVALDGESALESIADEKPSLILLDIMMPNMNGLELLQQLKDDPKLADRPMIMITAKNSQDELMEGYQHGADYYITKPFTVEQLVYGLKLFIDVEYRQKVPEA